MTREELIERLKGYEWNDIEFKKAQRGVPQSAYETVSAFCNTEGGWLVFGVLDRNGNYEIAGVIEVDKVQNDFLSALRADNKVNHDIQVEAKLIEVEGRTVLAFHIPEASRQNKPIYLSGDIRRSFIRRGGCDQHCTMTEIERFLRDAADERWDGQIFDFPPEEAFDQESVKWYRALFNERTPGHDESLSDQEFLHQWGYLIQKEERLQPTRASILLFGAPAAIHQMLPRPTLDAQWIPSNLGDPLPEVRWLDRVVFDDNLIVTWRGLVSRYMQKADKPFRIDPHTLLRNDAPPEYRVFREASINLLIHQDYASHGLKAVIKFYRDVIQFWNPGDVFGSADHLLEPGEKEVRNPHIVAAFRRLGLCEQAGTGIRMVLNQWKALGHPEPVYENDRSRKAFEMRLPLGQDQVTGEVKVQEAQVGTKSAPSQHQVKGEVIPPVIPPVTPPVERLIEVLGEHGVLGAADIRDKLGLKDRAHVREAYLNPSMNAGLVEYTIPEKPQSRLQRYRLTEAGTKLVEHLRQEKLN